MKRLIPCLLLAMSLPLTAQLSLDSSNREGKPILINSDAMDVEIEKGVATFYGNVVVNDPDIVITCQKMVLYQAPKADKSKKAAAKKKSKNSLEGNDAKLERIECIGDVVITRKNSGESSQWGTCGKAIYYHKDGYVTMSSEPVLYQDDSKITGIRLTFFRDSKRIEGTDIKITARNLNDESRNPKNPSKKKTVSDKKTDAAEVDKFYNGDKEDENSSESNTQSQKKDASKLSQKETDALLGLDTVPGKKK